MALLTFPSAPLNGEVYPVNPPVNTNIYQWSSADQTWVLLGKSSGVASGTYGDAITVPQITIDSTGRITFAQNVAIQLATTSQIGLVQLVDNTTTNDPTQALTAAAGYDLQNQIGDVNTLNPFYPNLVTAINTLGAPTGVTPGTYGNGLNVARFTVNAQGRLTFAGNVPLALATTVSPGVVRVGANLNINGIGILSVPNASTTVAGAVQLVNNTTTNDPTKALTAAAGFNLQQQIDNINVRNNLTFAGTVNGTTGKLTSVTPEGTAVGFVIGSQLPAPSAINDEYFVVITVAGTFTPPASPSYSVNVGDWLVSDGSQWVLFAFNLGSVTRVNTGTGLTGGPITSTGTISLVPATTTQLGGVIPDGTTIFVTPTGKISAAGPVTFRQLDDFSGTFNGTNKNFPLTIGGVPYTPGNAANLIVSVGGVMQIPGAAFGISGSTIQFTTAPPATATFVGYVVSNAAGGSGGGPGSVTSVGTGTGLTGGPITTTGTISLANTGVTAGTYTLSTITVNSQGQITSASSGSLAGSQFVYLDDISSQFNGTKTFFTLRLGGAPYTPTPPTNLMVTVGGVPQPPGTAYSVSGSTITFTGAPPALATFLAVTVA
jgi:hypothetical protein